MVIVSMCSLVTISEWSLPLPEVSWDKVRYPVHAPLYRIISVKNDIINEVTFNQGITQCSLWGKITYMQLKNVYQIFVMTECF